jgi:thiamine biosynthesis lipoprotein
MITIDSDSRPPGVDPLTEHVARFACFGSHCTVIVAGTPWLDGAGALALARHRLLQWHQQFSRFIPDSELSRLNADPSSTVAVSPLMRRVIAAALAAAADTGGLVDPTLTDEIERAGYAQHFDGAGIPLAKALALAPPRRRATARADAGWRQMRIDRRAGTVTRPSGVRIDPGGIAKGVFADELASSLGTFSAVVIDCGGDLRLGGKSGTVRSVTVESPFDDRILHTYELAGGGVATSGIGRRSWLHDGVPAHHLLDPGSGRPAFTGIVQATALAPTATAAEALSKAALLSGPDRAAGWLVHGGVLVFDDGSHAVVGAFG